MKNLSIIQDAVTSARDEFGFEPEELFANAHLDASGKRDDVTVNHMLKRWHAGRLVGKTIIPEEVTRYIAKLKENKKNGIDNPTPQGRKDPHPPYRRPTLTLIASH